MISFFYILHSDKLNRFYSGLTTITVQERLENHINKVYSKTNFTQKADDWTDFIAIPYQDF
ncbi:GIY-YIG nuclease family protein [Belliella sp. DSM 107340]|uniref:GIY-YIG nuclease family protein n=1 Tax=Belliella calami TaxID=2923436 RepID=A0ABS9UIL0_9BACT|nr:GIY-YIG nuclease family protein [Belliella calami]MCH7396451.1 GIY-YIG nuclease family protein [Belliella calami]